MKMSLDDTIEKMYDLIDKSVQLPFSGKKSLVDIEAMSSLIDQIRLDLPGEFQQAKSIVNDRKAIIADAKKEAESIIRRAEEKAANLISQQEISRQAQAKATEILTTAQQKSKVLRTTTNDYVETMLTRIETLLADDLTDVKKAKAAIKNSNK